MKKILIFLFLFFPLSLMAGQPWHINSTEKNGEAVRWQCIEVVGDKCKKWGMEWYVDPGPLVDGADSAKYIDSEKAVREWVKPMLDDWENVSLFYKVGKPAVKTTVIDIIFKGPMTGVGADIDVTDYTNFTTKRDDFRDMAPPVVIFDPDGAIIKDILIKQGNSEEYSECVRGGVDMNEELEPICNGVMVGLATPFADSKTRMFVSGFIILNGRLIDGENDDDNQEMDPDAFKAVIKHEFGHLLNLDHSQINYQDAERCRSSEEEACPEPEAIGSMYPMMKNSKQYTLHTDDIVGISYLYPSQDFLDKFCMIHGEILDSAGKPLQGVNVVATNTNDPLNDVRSFASGALYPPTNQNGEYLLAGIVPGEPYEVTYEPLDPYDLYNKVEGSTFGPLGKESPTGFEPGTILGPGGAATVVCKEADPNALYEIEMPAKKVFTDGGGGSTDPATASAESRYGKGWCQLQPGRFTRGGDLLFYFVPFLFFLLLVIWRRCESSTK